MNSNDDYDVVELCREITYIYGQYQLLGTHIVALLQFIARRENKDKIKRYIKNIRDILTTIKFLTEEFIDVLEGKCVG